MHRERKTHGFRSVGSDFCEPPDIPDPETAPVVVKIYDLVLKGWGNHRIRDYLRETKVPVPSWYMHIRGIEDKSHMFPDEESKYIWRPDTL